MFGLMSKNVFLSKSFWSNYNKMLIILDIDNTLVFTSSVWHHNSPSFTFRLKNQIYHVYERPHLYKFVLFLTTHYKVGIWTAATHDYAACILRHLFGNHWRKMFHFFYSRKHCRIWKGEYIKDLGQVADDCLLIDDNRVHFLFNKLYNPNNRIVLNCLPFFGYHNDTELLKLIRHLKMFEKYDSKHTTHFLNKCLGLCV